MADRFEDLRNFVTIAECGGVNAAAARLGIAKSAVSRRLAEFETRLGIVLADRAGRRFSLTTAGATVLADAQRVLADLELLETRGTRGAGTTVLQVAADRDLLDVVARAVAGLRRTMPDVEVGLADAADEDGRLTFSTSAGTDPGTRTIGTFHRGVFAAADGGPTPRTPADLRDVQAISIQGAGAAEWSFDSVDASPRIVMTVPDLRTGLASAAAGVGVVRAPAFAARSGPWAALLREVITPRVPDLLVTVSMTGESTPAADSLVDIVRRELARD